MEAELVPLEMDQRSRRWISFLNNIYGVNFFNLLKNRTKFIFKIFLFFILILFKFFKIFYYSWFNK